MILDVRGGSSKGSPEIYAQGHVPGAIYAPFSDKHWRATVDGVQKVLPPLPQIEAYIRSLGVDDDEHVVLVHSGIPGSAGDFGSAARVYWTFKALGHDAVSILDGGVEGWKGAGQPLAGAATAPGPAGNFTARPNPSVMAGVSDAASAIDGPAELVDSREHEAYAGGKPKDYVFAAGTIPTSVNVDANLMLDGGRIAAPENLRAMFSQVGVEEDEPVVTFCNSGHLGAVTWFVQHEVLGNENARLFDGSMSEWTMDQSRPVAKGDGPSATN